MSKNLKRSLAFGSTLALAAAGMVGFSAPAFAAAGDVTIKPNAGTHYSVFNTDEFVLKTSVITASVSAANLSYKITDADQGKWYVKLGANATFTGTIATSSVTLSGVTPLGVAGDMVKGGGANATVTLAIIDDGTTDGYGTSGDADEHYGDFVIDMGALGISEFTISGLGTTALQPGASNLITLSPYDGAAATSTGTAILSPAAGNAPVTNPDEADFGDGSYTATVQSWIETDADNETVDASYASAAQTVTWVDPKATSVIPTVERFVARDGTTIVVNDPTTNGNLGGSISFGQTINLDQFDVTKWESKIEESDGTVVSAAHTFATADTLGLAGTLTDDAAGKWYVTIDKAGANFTPLATKDYVLSVANVDAAAVWYGSTAFVPASNAAAVDQVYALVTDTANTLQTNYDDLTIAARAGTKSLTYTAQGMTANDTVAATSSIQMLALVTAGAYLTTGGGYSVTGSNKTLTGAGQATFVTGFTDSKGKYSVTVNSTLAAASESYTVTFYVLNGGDDKWTKVLNTGGTVASYVTTYAASTATTLTMDSSVVSGTDVVVGGTVTDQFATGTNLLGAKAVSVELKSANGTSIDKDVVVSADGTFSFSFANYVVAGASDVLTANTYTGTSSSPTNLGGALAKTVALYNPAASTAVQVPATLVTDVTYVDFLADGTKAVAATNPAPNNGVVLTGTVVDSNGSGVPAASVTIAGKGLQFLSGTKYYNDSVTVAASAAGVYSVTVFSHVLDSTGVAVTSTTSDGKTATTTLKTYLPAAGITGNNLSFKVNMPTNVVKNTTYAVVVELTDKWGNPVQTQAKNGLNAVSIQGVGSVQINSVDAATTKNFGKDGKTTVFLRSIKDIAGPGSVSATLLVAGYSATSAATATDLTVAEITTDVTTTVWDETVFSNSVEASVEVLDSAADIVAAPSATKTNVGSFKGYVALYAKGYKGQKMSAIVAGKWIVVASLASDFERVVRYTGAGYDIVTTIYIDGVKVETFNVTTK